MSKFSETSVPWGRAPLLSELPDSFAWQLGSGLPLTVTVERIREVLSDLTPRDRRLLEEALSKGRGRFWSAASVGDDFHAKLRRMFRSAGGRMEYYAVLRQLARKSPKLADRGDFLVSFLCLVMEDTTRDKVRSLVKSSQTRDSFEADAEWTGRSDLDAEYLWLKAVVLSQRRPWFAIAPILESSDPDLNEVREGLVFMPGGAVQELEGADLGVAGAFERFQEEMRDFNPEDADWDSWLTLRGEFERTLAVFQRRRRGWGQVLARVDSLQRNAKEKRIESEVLRQAVQQLEGRPEPSPAAERRRAMELVDKAEALLGLELELLERKALIAEANEEERYEAAATLAQGAQDIRDRRNACVEGLETLLETALDSQGGMDTRSGGPDAGQPSEPPPRTDFQDASAPEEGAFPKAGAGDGTAASDPGGDTRAPLGQDDSEAGEAGAESAPGERSPCSRQIEVEHAIASALRQGRIALAWRLAKMVDVAAPGTAAVRLVAWQHVAAPDESMEAEIPDLALQAIDFLEARFPPAADGSVTAGSRACSALLACTGLALAHRMPGGPVIALLQRLDAGLESLPELRALVRCSVKVLGATDIPLSDGILSGNRERLLAERQQEAGRWLEAERNSSLRYAPATYVWHRMLESWENEGKASIGDLLGRLAECRSAGKAEEARRIANHWRANGDREIDRLHAKRKTSSASKIDGPVRVKMRYKIGEALKIAGGLLECLTEGQAGSVGYQAPMARKLREAAASHGTGALAEVGPAGGEPADVKVVLLRRYLRLFEAGAPLAPEARVEQGLDDVLDGEFLLRPEGDAGLTLESALRAASEPVPEPMPALLRMIKGGDFERADRAADFALRSGKLTKDQLREFEDVWAAEHARMDAAWETQWAQVDARLADARGWGAVSAEDADRLSGELAEVIEAGGAVGLSRTTRLREIKEELDRGVRRLKKELRRRMRAVDGIDASTKHNFEKAVKENRHDDARAILEPLEAR